MSEDEPEGMFSAKGSPEDPEFVEEALPEDDPSDVSVPDDERQSLRDVVMQRTGMDFGIFGEAMTWKAFAISVVLFSFIAYTGLTVFGLSASLLSTGGEAEQATDFVIPTLNRTDIEGPVVNETGWFRLSEHRGEVVIIDFMAHDCSNCHTVQKHLEDEMDGWSNRDSTYNLTIIAVGSWYSEDLAYLNTSGGTYHVPYYATGMGSTTAAIINASTDERADVRDEYNAFAIPIVYVLDHEGYIVATRSTGIGDWGDFDAAVIAALDGEAEELRLGLRDIGTDWKGIFFLGMMLSVLVYFSPCAFPVLPGFISYYLSLGAREEELIAAGKLKGKMPSAVVIGLLSGIGMWTFFLIIGGIAAAMGEAFARSGIITYIALGVAILLLVLGFFMLTGGTAHLTGFVQRFVDRYSTTEADETFTPRRNMYLYGIGYAAASIDCTAAAVIPLVVYLSTLGGDSVLVGLGALMLGLLILMVFVTSMVSLGSQVMIDFLRRSTGMIKMVGSWMMMFAGIGLTIFLTNPEFIATAL